MKPAEPRSDDDPEISSPVNRVAGLGGPAHTHAPRREGPEPDGQGHQHILVTIPTYNEEVAIASLVLRAKRYADEVLVIDDGSDDNTVEIARQAGAKVLENDENRGKGYSVQRAFEYAKESDADALVLMDGDGQHDTDEIPDLVGPVLHHGNGGPVDMALGYRAGEMTEMPAWRRVGKRVLDYVTATAAGSREMLTDSQCGFRAFSKDAIEVMDEHLTEHDFGIESEQIMIAREQELSVENVEIHCRYEDIEGANTKDPFSHGFGVLRQIIEMTTQRRPLLFVGVPSMLLLLAGVFVGIETFQIYNEAGYFSIPYALSATTLGILGTFGLLVSTMLNLMASFERKLDQAVQKHR